MSTASTSRTSASINLTVALRNVVEDPATRCALFGHCWVQEKWCSGISSKGAFFCKAASVLDMILDGPGGWPTEKGWWKKVPGEFQDQIERYCDSCGMCVPLEREAAVERDAPGRHNVKEKVSPSLLEEFRSLDLRNVSDRRVEVYRRHSGSAEMEQITPGWTPCNCCEDIQENDLDESAVRYWLMTTSDFFAQLNAAS